MPSARDAQGREIAAVRGVVGSVLGMINGGVRHLGVATDHVIESFRNRLWPGYKTGDGIEPDLLAQFPLLEDALSALGVAVWPMIEFEADDALASVATAAARDARVERVVICTPDKDLAQCVTGTRVVQMHRRTRVTLDEAGVKAKFGVAPASIPDYLALVGDSADGYPGLRGWGAKSSAAVLAKYGRLEAIPEDCRTWGVNAASPGALAGDRRRVHPSHCVQYLLMANPRTGARLWGAKVTMETQRVRLEAVLPLNGGDNTDHGLELLPRQDVVSLIEIPDDFEHEGPAPGIPVLARAAHRRQPPASPCPDRAVRIDRDVLGDVRPFPLLGMESPHPED